jgi:hypothetical protein
MRAFTDQLIETYIQKHVAKCCLYLHPEGRHLSDVVTLLNNGDPSGQEDGDLE